MLHIDPDSTAYWNAVVHGRKRWMFLRPEELDAAAAAIAASGNEVLLDSLAQLAEPGAARKPRKNLASWVRALLQQITAVRWFSQLLPMLHQADITVAAEEALVEAGELIYGPPGVFHIALALEDSVGCSEQLVDEGNVLRFVQDEEYRPAFAHLGCAAGHALWPELMEPLAEFCARAASDLKRLAAGAGRSKGRRKAEL
ncbi:unnamed protein product [Polarella glacialis]|uniref:JmjC domain-containing protein n=1 Tax=Polarella glacialis TaxID=89957 RepID=A0A813EQ32_POLGL|nr:unnamed protein product [Polarella glacialis]